MNRSEIDLRDTELANSCGCCLCCEKYKTVKEQNKMCDIRKARKRLIDRQIYRLKHKNKG